MRLYLSSRRFGNRPKELISLAKENYHVGIIINAGDNVNGERRKTKVEKQSRLLSELGFTAEEIDLRKFFGRESALREHMKKFGFVWVRGGNIFLLRRAYAQSGFDDIIVDMINNDEIVYAGDSAGAAILGPTLHGLESTSPIDLVPVEYASACPMDGLGVIDYIILPHYKSNHNESHVVELIAEAFRSNKITHKVLRDGEVIVVNGNQEHLFS